MSSSYTVFYLHLFRVYAGNIIRKKQGCVSADNDYVCKVSEDVASQRLRQEATKEEPKGQAMHVPWLLR